MRSSQAQALPAAPDIENCLLGAAILNGNILADVVANLSEEAFTDPKHRLIYSVLRDFHLEGKEADAFLVHDRLKSKGAVGQSIPANFISSMLEVIPAPSMARGWRQELEKKQSARRLIKMAGDLSRAAYAGDDPAWILEEFSYRFGVEVEASTGSSRIAPLNITKAISTLPTHRPFIVAGYVPAGVVGLLSGTGGLGKSYMVLLMATATATGKHLPPFTPETAGKVLLVNVEDGTDDLAPRLHWVVKHAGLDADDQARLNENLVIFPGRGQVGPLAQLDASGNPTPSRHYAWLRQQIGKHDPALVVLDTKSRLYGLEENSNDHAAQWLVMLERLIAEHPQLSILVVSHTSKATANNQDAHALRGASAIADNSRFVLSLSAISKEEAKILGITESEGAKLVHAKSSYSMAQPPVFFRRDEHGVPVVLDREQMNIERLGGALDSLVEVLRRDWPEGVAKRDLERGLNDGRAIRDEVLSDIDLPKSLWPEVVKFGIESARLMVLDDPNSMNNRPGKLIKTVWPAHG